MNKDEVLNAINRNDMLGLIYGYCIDKGKPEIQVSSFVTALERDAMLNPFRSRMETSFKDYCFDYALRYYTDKFNIILLFDKNNNFIKAF